MKHEDECLVGFGIIVGDSDTANLDFADCPECGREGVNLDLGERLVDDVDGLWIEAAGICVRI